MNGRASCAAREGGRRAIEITHVFKSKRQEKKNRKEERICRLYECCWGEGNIEYSSFGSSRIWIVVWMGEEKWCVVTGGRGFAARHLVEMLIRYEIYHVRIADLGPAIKLEPHEENGTLGKALQSGRALYLSMDLLNKSQVFKGIFLNKKSQLFLFFNMGVLLLYLLSTTYQVSTREEITYYFCIWTLHLNIDILWNQLGGFYFQLFSYKVSLVSDTFAESSSLSRLFFDFTIWRCNVEYSFASMYLC